MVHQVQDKRARVEGAQQRVVSLQVEGDNPGGKLARNGDIGPESNVQRPQTVIAQQHIRLVGMHEGERGPEGTDSRVSAHTVSFDHIARRFNGLTIAVGLAVHERVGHLPAGVSAAPRGGFGGRTALHVRVLLLEGSVDGAQHVASLQFARGMGPQDGIQDGVLGHQAVLKDGLRGGRAALVVVALDVAQGDSRRVAVAYEPQQIDGLMLGRRPQQVQRLDGIGVGSALVAV